MLDYRADANVIKPELERLINAAKPISPKLADRLSELENWVKKKQVGKLRRKKPLCDFLTEVIVDADFWLKLQLIAPEDQLIVFKSLSLAQRLWYVDLFPCWFNEPDPKIRLWKSKIMEDGFSREDENFLGCIADQIEKYGGSALRNYILDFSMATDILVSGTLNKPLCTQLTISNPIYTENKISNWKLTLCHWKIKRGLFVSYNPNGEYRILSELGQFLLQKGDELEPECYSVYDL